MENQGKKKFISGSKVKVSTVVIVSVVLAVLLALSSFGFVVFNFLQRFSPVLLFLSFRLLLFQFPF